MKIAVVSFGDAGVKDWTEHSFPNFQAYCDTQGYDFIGGNKAVTNRPPAWEKIPLLYGVMDSYDWLMWIDADALIMRHDFRIEDFLSDHDFIVSGNKTINSGVFFVRCCDFSRQFLKDIYAQNKFINHVWWENAALIHLLNYSHYSKSDRIRLDNYATYNVFPDRFRNDFIIHFAGEHKNINHFRQYANK